MSNIVSNTKINKVLITGGAGFIGTHLAERLADKCSVVLLDSFRRDSLSSVPALKNHKNVQVITADICDEEQVNKALEDVDVVVHLAAIAGVSSYYAEPLRTLETNVLGTVNTLRQAGKHKIKSFIYFSTSEVFGPDALWVEENAPHKIGSATDKRWVYATSKLVGENFVLRYAEKYGFDCTIVRPFNVYGPRQVGEGAISNFCRAVSQKQALKIYGDGSAIRAWCYVSDLVDAVEAIMQTPSAAGETFNIGNPREVESTLGLARRVVNLASDVKIEFQDGVHAEVRARVPVIDKARKILKFEPKVDLDKGLANTIAWFQEDERN